MAKEIWKPIKGYVGMYEVSSCGRVRSLDRYKNNGHKNGLARIPGRIKKTDIDRNGRIRVELSKEGKNKKYLIYRLVADAFIPNPQNFREINHIDENISNNSLENLEWCDRKYNCNYGTRNNRISQSKFKPTSIYKGDKKIMSFNSVEETARYFGYKHSSFISSSIKRKRKIKGLIIKFD